MNRRARWWGTSLGLLVTLLAVTLGLWLVALLWTVRPILPRVVEGMLVNPLAGVHPLFGVVFAAAGVALLWGAVMMFGRILKQTSRR